MTPAAPLKLLMVEDDECTYLSLSAILEQAIDCDVLWAASLPEARALLAERPDVVLLDLMLPGEDGEDLIDEIRDREDPARIVVVTALLDGSPRIARVRAMQPEAIVFKPYVVPALVDAVKDQGQACPPTTG